MTKVIQIRDVPDDVRDALAEAASSEGLSLTGYVRRELEIVARRTQRARENTATVEATKKRVRGAVDRDAIIAALDDGRGR
jgi:hypothetical protein